MLNSLNTEKYTDALKKASLYTFEGNIKQVKGFYIESNGPSVSLGDICYIDIGKNRYLRAEAVGFDENRVFLMPLGDMAGIKPGARVISYRKPFNVVLNENILGCVLNGLGEVIDGDFEPIGVECNLNRVPPDPLKRDVIKDILETGVSAIDALLTVGRGQRMGIFAGSGVGKSSLLGMIARYTSADVAVIGLIGERGREVNEFLEYSLGEEGRKKSVVVVATNDQPALVRIKAALMATTIAEYFRDMGKDVVLMMDSVTRLAMAQREVGVAVNEPTTTRGYTPSVFSLLAKLLERSGKSDKGSITGFYTVLVEGDDMNEPIADAARSILDGHIVLSRDLAHINHYPAIDILGSISRVMSSIVDEKHSSVAKMLREHLANYREAEDLINIGAYVKGSNKAVDSAIENIDKIKGFLKQGVNEKRNFSQSYDMLLNLFRDTGEDAGN